MESKTNRIFSRNWNTPRTIPPVILALLVLATLAVGGSEAFETDSTPHDICQKETTQQPVTGYISGVYCAYNKYDGDRFLYNPLGNPKAGEIDITDEWGKGNSYQEFDNGRIYLHREERAAFALFNDILDTYLGSESNYGFPITSQIGGPDECRAYFDKGYMHCDGTAHIWTSFSKRLNENKAYHDIPVLKMPFDQNKTGSYTGGLHHGTELAFQFGAETYVWRGNSLDFQNNSNREILAVASGTVIDVDRVGTVYRGGHLAVRSDFSGIVVIYGHVRQQPVPSSEKERIDPGDWIEQGDVIGLQQDPCTEPGDDCYHVHLELRDGTRCADSDFDCRFGEPVDWQGLTIDNYLISSFFTSETTSKIRNYDGSAMRGSGLDAQRKYSQSALRSKLKNIPELVYKECKFNDDGEEGTLAWTWMTKTYADKQGDSIKCDSYSDTNLVFAMGKVVSTNAPLTVNNKSFIDL